MADAPSAGEAVRYVHDTRVRAASPEDLPIPAHVSETFLWRSEAEMVSYVALYCSPIR